MKQIVSFSGGKDSTAMLLMMLERDEPIYSIVFCDTGWEFPDMLKHIDKVERYISRKITRVRVDLPQMFLKKGWPLPNLRWCTGLKRDALSKYHGKNKPYISCRGLTSDEINRANKRKARVHTNCLVRYPLQEWQISSSEALRYCYEKGFDWNGLYEHFHRVSCFCCPFQSLSELRNLRRHFPDLWKQLKSMEENTQYSFRQNQTIHDLEKRFKQEDRQKSFFF